MPLSRSVPPLELSFFVATPHTYVPTPQNGRCLGLFLAAVFFGAAPVEHPSPGECRREKAKAVGIDDRELPHRWGGRGNVPERAPHLEGQE